MSPKMKSGKSLTPSINFGGGLNTKTTASQIKDNESPDMLNMTNDEYGTSFKRNGSTRYNPTAIGAGAILGLYRGYKSDATKKMLIAQGVNIYIGTDATGAVTSGIGSLTASQKYFFETFNDLVIICNKADATNKYNFSTIAALGGTPPKAQYVKAHKGYLFLGKVNYSAADYLSRVWYSAVGDPETWGANSFFTVQLADGDVITGLESFNNVLYVFKNRSIHAVMGDVFDPNTGDYSIAPILKGVGCVADKTLVNTGTVLIFLASDGIRVFNGGTSDIISNPVENIVNSIPAARIADCAGVYDPVKKWYWFSYNDNTVTPSAVNNSILVYDLRLGLWYKFGGLNINNFCVWNGVSDKNELYVGDSNDGYVHKLNDVTQLDDARQEKVIATFEASESWTGDGVADTTDFKEGLQGLKFSPLIDETKTGNLTKSLDLSLHTDNLDSSTSDYIHIWAKIDDPGNLLLIKILFDVNTGNFTTDYFSYTLDPTEITMIVGWNEFNVLKSDFTRTGSTSGKGWNSVGYIRLQVTAIYGAVVVTLDDLRLLHKDKKIIFTHRKTKMFDLNKPEIEKHFKDLYLQTHLSTDWELNTEIYFNSSETQKANTINILTPNFYLVNTTYDGVNKRLKSGLSYIARLYGAGSGNDQFSNPFGIAVDDTHIYIADRDNHRIVKRLKADALTYVAKIGSSGSGNDNFSNPNGIAVDNTYIYISDKGNNRIVKRLKADALTFVAKIGSTGSGNDQFDTVTSIAVDDTHLYIADTQNHRIVKRLKSDLSYVSKIGSAGSGDDQFQSPQGIAVDEYFLYIADTSNHRIQKRHKSNLAFISKIGSSGSGNDNFNAPLVIAVDDTYIYVGDTDNSRLVKRLKTDLSYVTKFDSSGTGNDGIADITGLCVENVFSKYYSFMTMKTNSIHLWREGKNIQFKFYNNKLSENIKLYKMSMSLRVEQLR